MKSVGELFAGSHPAKRVIGVHRIPRFSNISSAYCGFTSRALNAYLMYLQSSRGSKARNGHLIRVIDAVVKLQTLTGRLIAIGIYQHTELHLAVRTEPVL